MKPPEHHFVNEYGQREVKRFWLGSGVKDKNGKEIFEGDILLWFSFGGTPHKLPVAFRDGCFCYKDIDGKYYPLEPDNAKHLEVIGHIAEDITP